MWSEDPVKLFLGAFGATLEGIVTNINSEQQDEEDMAVSPLAARLKGALNKHVAPLPGQVSGLVDRVESVGERAGKAITNAHDAVSVAEGLLAEVEAAEQAVNEILEIVPGVSEAPLAMPGRPIPPGMVGLLVDQNPIPDAGLRGDHPAMAVK